MAHKIERPEDVLENSVLFILDSVEYGHLEKKGMQAFTTSLRNIFLSKNGSEEDFFTSLHVTKETREMAHILEAANVTILHSPKKNCANIILSKEINAFARRSARSIVKHRIILISGNAEFMQAVNNAQIAGCCVYLIHKAGTDAHLVRMADMAFDITEILDSLPLTPLLTFEEASTQTEIQVLQKPEEDMQQEQQFDLEQPTTSGQTARKRARLSNRLSRFEVALESLNQNLRAIKDSEKKFTTLFMVLELVNSKMSDQNP